MGHCRDILKDIIVLFYESFSPRHIVPTVFDNIGMLALLDIIGSAYE
jgi:hypothetical protein